jgi:thioredoxin 1
MTTATLSITCPSCSEPYHVSPDHLGKNLRCRKCDQIFEIRASGGRANEVSEAPGPPEAASHPIAVTDADFNRTVLSSPTPVLVDFWAPWCAPCRAIAPALEQLAAEYAGRATIAKLNADENQRTMMQYGVQGLPTLLIFKGGQEVARLVGLRPKPAIKQALDHALTA